jgi:PHD/YefM family antitoxin component YafN of YafNO toxin-antitoxin module
MLVETDRMIPITKLQKELTKRIRDISAESSPLYILKNNELEAVILAPAEYEYLMNLSELIEQYEINDVIKKRMRNYKRSKNIKWQDLKKI